MIERGAQGKAKKGASVMVTASDSAQDDLSLLPLVAVPQNRNIRRVLCQEDFPRMNSKAERLDLGFFDRGTSSFPPAKNSRDFCRVRTDPTEGIKNGLDHVNRL